MDDDYLKFQKYLLRVRSIHFNALCAFTIFETIEKLRDPSISGKLEVVENLNVMNRYNGFFVITRHALNFYFLTELTRILDNAKQSLHLTNLINFASKNTNSLSVKKFEEHNPKRPFLRELVSNYKGLTEDDFLKINKQLDDTKLLRKRIKIYRDQNLAHEDMEKAEITISRDDIMILFKLIAEILNIFSQKTDHSSTTYEFAREECITQTQNLIRNLKRK